MQQPPQPHETRPFPGLYREESVDVACFPDVPDYCDNDNDDDDGKQNNESSNNNNNGFVHSTYLSSSNGGLKTAPWYVKKLQRSVK